jgi:hypothetical protein
VIKLTRCRTALLCRDRVKEYSYSQVNLRPKASIDGYIDTYKERTSLPREFRIAYRSMTSMDPSLSNLATELQLHIIKHLFQRLSPSNVVAFLCASPVAASTFRRYGQLELHNQILSLVSMVCTLSVSRGRIADRPNCNKGVSFRRWRKAVRELERWVEFGLRWAWASGRNSDFIERLLRGEGPCFRKFGSVGILRYRVRSRKRMLAGVEVLNEWNEDSDKNWTGRLLMLRNLRNGKVRL